MKPQNSLMSVATPRPQPSPATGTSTRRGGRRRWVAALACLLGLGAENLVARDPIADKPKETKSDGDKSADKKPAKPEDEWYEVGSDLSMSASWNNGLELATKNKDFRVHVGGRTQFDSSWFAVPENVNDDPTLRNPIHDGVDFRRARLRVDGTMWEQIEWAAEFDFVNSAGASSAFPGVANATSLVAPTDLWWTFTKLPVVGNMRVGDQKEPIGFEHLTSSRFLNFM